MTSPFPEPASPQLEPYMVYARAEIAALLRRLREAGVLVTAYFKGDPGFGVTTLLAVDEKRGAVVFDNLSDAGMQRLLMGSEKITFVGFVDAIKLQFTSGRAKEVSHDGQPAFEVPLPSDLLRLQRREAFRVKPPLSKPATCKVPYGDEGKTESLRVIDISAGGLAVLTHPARLNLTAGQVVEGCTLDMPGVGSTGVSLRVLRVQEVPNAEDARRLGCEFVSLAPATQLALQRYINKLDAEARKLAARG